MVVDINDFLSFGQVPHAVTLASSHIIHRTGHLYNPKAIELSDTLTEVAISVV